MGARERDKAFRRGHGAMNSGLRYYVLFIAALGAAALAQSLRTLSLERVDPLMLAILIALAAAAQRMPVFLFRSSAISISFAAVIASYVLYGVEMAVIVSLFQAGVNAVTPRPKPLLKALFNAGLRDFQEAIRKAVERLGRHRSSAQFDTERADHLCFTGIRDHGELGPTGGASEEDPKGAFAGLLNLFEVHVRFAIQTDKFHNVPPNRTGAYNFSANTFL